MKHRRGHDHEGNRATRISLWCAAAAVVGGAHLAFAWVALMPATPQFVMGDPAPAIMVDLPPMTESSEAAPSLNELSSALAGVATPHATETSDAVATPDIPPEPPEPPMPEPRAFPGTIPLPPRPPESRPSRAAVARRLETPPAPSRERVASSDAPASTALPPVPDTATTIADLPSSWKSRLLSHLNRYKRYPAEAHGAEGTAVLSFAMDRQGQLLGFFIARSSGDPALDAEALAMIQRAVPLPAFPAEISASTLQLTVPVRFITR